jgi:hypothetical protein
MWRRCKSSPTVAQQHRQMLCFMVRERKIEPTVPVEIADGNIVWTMPVGKRRAGRRRKASFAISQQHGGIAALLVRCHDIELTIAIEISDRNAAWGGSDREMQVARRGCRNAPSRSDR